jgi:hypothetical protein
MAGHLPILDSCIHDVNTQIVGAISMDEPTPTLAASSPTETLTPFLDADNLIRVFTHFLTFDIADGADSAETIVAYWSQIKAYLNWCQTNSVDPAAASRETIKLYRHYIIQHGYGRNTIALKLAAVRRSGRKISAHSLGLFA